MFLAIRRTFPVALYLFLQTHGVVVVNSVPQDETSNSCFLMASQFEKCQFFKQEIGAQPTARLLVESPGM